MYLLCDKFCAARRLRPASTGVFLLVGRAFWLCATERLRRHARSVFAVEMRFLCGAEPKNRRKKVIMIRKSRLRVCLFEI